MDTFVGREEDIRNITGYLDFTSSDVQVVHIVGPPGFGKSTLAKQIGHNFLRKGVKVYYADIRAITDFDTVAEKIMLGIVDSMKYKVTFDRLEYWVQTQYSNTLVILDNCDEMFENHEKEFLGAIRTLALSSYTRSVRYILTSQKWEADVGNYFQIHTIHNLSSEAASQLLGKLAPSLTDVQKMQIAELTGNVPLALDVVGAIFKFPNAPTVEKIIQDLKKNPVTPLSPPELLSNVDVCISLAYSFLSPELKELCVNLSQFPGSFDQFSASRIVSSGIDIEPQLKTLVRRSLLFNHHIQIRFHFHRLIREYFLLKTGGGKRCEELLQCFKSRFLSYFGYHLKHILEVGNSKLDFAMTMLDADKHNFQCMFAMFTTAEQNNVTLYAVTTTLTAIRSNFLRLRFSDKEIYNILQNMLKAMESYSADEEASHESFLETYYQVVLQMLSVGKLLHVETHSLLEMLITRQSKAIDAYKRELLGVDIYIQFFNDMAQLYKKNGDDVKSRWCHAHILSSVHNKLHGCYPDCDYFNVSLAYESVGESVEAFHFRELAFEHQATSLDRMSLIQLHLALYNDYMNSSLGNIVTKADEFASLIVTLDYNYLISADECDYRKEVYYDALDFFRGKHMEDCVVQIQNKMLTVEQKQCSHSLKSCVSSSLYSWHRQAYFLTIELGKVGIHLSKALHETHETHLVVLSVLVGKSYYHIGNYSDAQIWLNHALQIVNEHFKNNHSLSLRDMRLKLCTTLLMSGDYFNTFCYRYIIIDFVNILFVEITNEEYEIKQPKKQPAAKTIRDTEIEMKYSFGLSQFSKYVQHTIDSHVSRAETIVNQISYYLIWLMCLFGMYALYNCIIICLIRRLLSLCCTEQQTSWCVTCCTFILLTINVFVLGLDWLLNKSCT